jgi:hypothetical protein
MSGKEIQYCDDIISIVMKRKDNRDGISSKRWRREKFKTG